MLPNIAAKLVWHQIQSLESNYYIMDMITKICGTYANLSLKNFN